MANTLFAANMYVISSDSALPTKSLNNEQIALHSASNYGGAQFYIGCAQVNVANGGSGTPGPLVSIPGVYTGVSPRWINPRIDHAHFS